MKEKTKRHVERAMVIYGQIDICPKCKTWDNSFCIGKFWFNTEDESTHCIKEESDNEHLQPDDTRSGSVQ